jgi:hypothetical protein
MDGLSRANDVAGASAFLDLLWLLAPERNDLVAVLQAFFDESYGPEGLVCVAGYIFTKSKAQVFDRAWRAMLRRYCLPYFRMSSCAHGADPFAGLTKEQRISVLKEAISIIHVNALHGVAATVLTQHRHLDSW